MKIVVCVKQVPDTAAKVAVDASGQVTWGEAPLILNPWDEYAVEAALQKAETAGGTVTALSMGPASAKEALKSALAMGCQEAVLVSDPALAEADTQAAARVLAAAIQKIGGVDLVLFGKQAVDGDGGVTAAQTARTLGWPILSLASAIPTLDATGVRVERATEEGRQIVRSKLPAVISVVKDFGEPRYPSFMGIKKASRAQIPTWTLADLGIPAPAPAVTWPALTNPPSREVACEFISGETPQEIAQNLVDRLIAEKVL